LSGRRRSRWCRGTHPRVGGRECARRSRGGPICSPARRPRRRPGTAHRYVSFAFFVSQHRRDLVARPESGALALRAARLANPHRRGPCHRTTEGRRSTQLFGCGRRCGGGASGRTTATRPQGRQRIIRPRFDPLAIGLLDDVQEDVGDIEGCWPLGRVEGQHGAQEVQQIVKPTTLRQLAPIDVRQLLDDGLVVRLARLWDVTEGLAREDVVEHGAQAIGVGADRHRPTFRGAPPSAEPTVATQAHHTRPIDLHRRRLEVAVHRLVFIGDGEQVGKVGHQLERSLHGQRLACHQRHEIDARRVAFFADDLTRGTRLAGVEIAHAKSSRAPLIARRRFQGAEGPWFAAQGLQHTARLPPLQSRPWRLDTRAGDVG
jgi:hypothetical protein